LWIITRKRERGGERYSFRKLEAAVASMRRLGPVLRGPKEVMRSTTPVHRSRSFDGAMEKALVRPPLEFFDPNHPSFATVFFVRPPHHFILFRTVFCRVEGNDGSGVMDEEVYDRRGEGTDTQSYGDLL
jgi:hypothetical protein